MDNNGSASNVSVAVWFYPAGSATNDGSESGDAAITGTQIIYGAQLEQNDKPTSYAPTSTAIVTREIDLLTTTDVSWLDTAATAVGTFVVDAFVSHLSTADQRYLVEIDDGSNDDRVALFIETDSTVALFSQNSVGDNGYITSASPITANSNFLCAVNYADDDSNLSLDGATIVNENLCSFPLSDNITTLRVGVRFGDVEALNGFVKNIRYSDVQEAGAFLLNPDPFNSFASNRMNMGMGIGI